MGPVEKITSATKIVFEDGVVQVIGIGEPHSAETVVETFEVIRDLTGEVKHPMLFDVRDWGPIELPAWVEFVRQIEQTTMAAAVVADPDMSTEFADTFVGMIDRLVIPFRIYSEEAAARTFLADYAVEID